MTAPENSVTKTNGTRNQYDKMELPRAFCSIGLAVPLSSSGSAVLDVDWSDIDVFFHGQGGAEFRSDHHGKPRLTGDQTGYVSLSIV
jgi:hypothetical protein